VRNPSSLSFSNTTPATFLALPLDGTSRLSNEAAFETAFKKKKKNLASMSPSTRPATPSQAAWRSSPTSRSQQQMEVHYFGLDMTRKAMQTLREQTQSGGLI
jgi:hypothetical protein